MELAEVLRHGRWIRPLLAREGVRHAAKTCSLAEVFGCNSAVVSGAVYAGECTLCRMFWALRHPRKRSSTELILACSEKKGLGTLISEGTTAARTKRAESKQKEVFQVRARASVDTPTSDVPFAAIIHGRQCYIALSIHRALARMLRLFRSHSTCSPRLCCICTLWEHRGR